MSPPTSPFGKLLQWDRDMSFLLYRRYHASLPRLPLLLLEVSGHGVPWLVLPIALYLFQPGVSAGSASLLLNFVALTVVDLAAIGVLKPLFRRQRPAYNSGIGQVTIHLVDQFSFPSGHATRAGLVVAFLALAQTAHAHGLAAWLAAKTALALALAWGLAVCASRVALGRHHVLDVLVGAVVGVAYVLLWRPVWIGDEVAARVRDELRQQLLGSGKLAAAATTTTTVQSSGL